MRSRLVRSSHFLDETLGTADPLLLHLYLGLSCLADRDGKLENRPLKIKAQIFPYRNVDIDKLLAALAKSGHIKIYKVCDNTYIRICSFTEEQHPHKTEASSKIPDFSDGCALTVIAPLSNGSTLPCSDTCSDTDTITVKQPLKVKTEYPEWLPIEAWEGFVEMRNKIKEPLTGRAVKLAFSTLEKLMANGENAEAVLNQSTFNNYRGLFPVKNKNTELRTPKITTLEDMLKEVNNAQ